MSDYTKVMRERTCASKQTEGSDHKEVLHHSTLTLRSGEEHVRVLVVNNMASSFEPNAHPYLLRNYLLGCMQKWICKIRSSTA